MSEFTAIILGLLWRFYPIAWLTTAIVRGLPAIIPVMPTTTIFGVRPPTTIPTTTIFSFGGSDDFRLRQDPTTIVSLDAGDDDDFFDFARRRFSPPARLILPSPSANRRCLGSTQTIQPRPALQLLRARWRDYD